MKHYSPQNISTVNIWQVIKGQTLTPLTCSGVKKLATIPTISKAILDNFKTEVTLPDGFGVAQNVISGEQRLFVHYAPKVLVLGDLILSSLVILSGNIAEISVTGGDDNQKAFLPVCLSFH